jgi:hypothetical protein
MSRVDADVTFSEPRLISRVEELKILLVAESAAREKTDAGALDLVMHSMEKLQADALANYGTE